MPTRREAIITLYQLINSGILSTELKEKLKEIATCIEAEEKKEIFIWGVEDDDWAELYAVREPELCGKAWYRYMDALQQKYAIHKRGGKC